MGEKQTQTKAAETQTSEEFAALLSRPFRPMGASDEPFSTPDQFEHIWRVAKAYAESEMVPEVFRKKVADCAIVVALAWRHKADPLMFFQHMYPIKGKPGMDAQLAIAIANASGRFIGPITHELERDDAGRAIACTASVVLRETAQVVTGSRVGIEMVASEGWGAQKWKNMPDHMFRFRSSVFMLREYFPELLMGMYSTDELEDIAAPETTPASASLDALKEKVAARAARATAKTAQTKAESKAESKAETKDAPAELPPMAPNGTPAVAVPEILDNLPDEPPVEPAAPEEPEAAPPAAPAAPQMSARDKKIATLKEVCESRGKKLPPVTRMSDEALDGYIKTLSALPVK